DRYIHTNFDTAAHIDPTKLRRAAFVGAASGYFLANFSARDIPATAQAVARGKLFRAALSMERNTQPGAAVTRKPEAGPLEEYERAVAASVESFGAMTSKHASAARKPGTRGSGTGDVVYSRAPEPKGPLTVFGYDYLASHAKATGVPIPRLLSYEGEWGSGEEYAYEALNFADGTRTAQQIATELSTEYGPVPVELVAEYLQTLAKIGVVR